MNKSKFPGVEIDKDCIIYPGVNIGKGSRIEGPCVIGKPPRGKRPGQLPAKFGLNVLIRPFTVIYAGSILGDNVETGTGVIIREDNIIYDGVSIGTNTVLEIGNRIGKNTRIHTGCFLERVTVGENVFIGPCTVFTDDPHPMKCPKFNECARGAQVQDLAKIGAGVTILPRIKIGRGALIGAGSVVTKDVPKDTVAAGNPARKIKNIKDLRCIFGYFKRPYLWPPYEVKQWSQRELNP